MRASLLLLVNLLIMEPMGQDVLYPSAPAVTGVDLGGDTEDEMNSCVLGCLDYGQIITQHPCSFHLLGSLPLPPGAVVTVRFVLDSNFKSNFYVNP